MGDWSSLPILPNIQARTLVFRGEFDTSHAVAQEPFERLIPDVSISVIPDAGHFCHIEPEHRDQVMRLVGEFLTSS